MTLIPLTIRARSAAEFRSAIDAPQHVRGTALAGTPDLLQRAIPIAAGSPAQRHGGRNGGRDFDTPRLSPANRRSSAASRWFVEPVRDTATLPEP
ncbi:TPA: hypothetical protein SAY52_004265 [Burkholderia cenocepacia]|uniref:hypothetical protein n=1 Tax=unclassified Burkholderia TaxID=2613784 RepID=UPI00158A8A90|nr:MULTISPECIES: hypothetical protein [unclassified Burkholderia]HEF5873609.1 hypothetical protein [Burkholderia cenocepacia]